MPVSGVCSGFLRNTRAKSRENSWKNFPASRNATRILGFRALAKANLLGTLGRHCLDLVPTFRAGCFFEVGFLRNAAHETYFRGYFYFFENLSWNPQDFFRGHCRVIFNSWGFRGFWVATPLDWYKCQNIENAHKCLRRVLKVIWSLWAESPKRVSRTVQTLPRTGRNSPKHSFAPCKRLLWDSHSGGPKTPFALSLNTFGHFGCFDTCTRPAGSKLLGGEDFQNCKVVPKISRKLPA